MNLQADQAAVAGDPVEALLGVYSPEVRDLAQRARALVLDVAPGLVEQVDAPGKLLGYGWAATVRPP
jgi:hypothetical protein